jgi:hypothetical protein
LIGAWLNSEEENKLVTTYEEKVLKYFDKEDIKKLVELIAKWRLLLGVTSEGSDSELLVITQFVYDNYPNITLSDIEFAMNWTISGKIEVGFVSQKNISSYYVSRAINAFIVEKKRIIEDIAERKRTYQAQLEPEKIEQTPVQKANTFKSIILNLYDTHKKGKPLIDYNDIVYEWLKKSKNLCLEPEVISKAIRYGKQRVIEERQDNSLYGNINKAFDNEKELREKKHSRVYMIMYFFDYGEKSIKDIVDLIDIKDFN